MTTPMSPEDLLTHIRDLGIETSTMTHSAVYTVEEAKTHRHGLIGAHSKNLFLRDKKGRMFLLTTLEDRAINLKSLADELGVRSLSFGSAERLQKYLGVTPGSVTPFGVINDTEGGVTMVLDRGLMDFETLNFHPLINTQTTSISPAGLIQFLESTNHPPMMIDL